MYTTEITSDTLTSDNPVHQRLFKAYVVASSFVKGEILEVGCGNGRGVALLMPLVKKFTAIDKYEEAVRTLKGQFPQGEFKVMNIPPFQGIPDESFDQVISFQVIEHIQDDEGLLREIHRVLKPGGFALLTTPNKKMSLTRNPWHIREYFPEELQQLAQKIFPEVTLQGITGNEKVMRYHDENRQSVRRIMRWDFLNLQHRLPAAMLKVPYEILNRVNRKKLEGKARKLVEDISHEDYRVVDDPSEALDLLLRVRK